MTMKKYGGRSHFCIIAAIVLGGTLLQASAQEKAKPESTSKETSVLTIARLVVGTGVENLEPAGVAESFPTSTEKVYCFLEATNITQDTEVSFVWFHGQSELLKFNLPLVKGPKWRTFAFKNLYGQKGDWRVEIRDAEGKPLKEVKFKVE
jgi:Protein of unknown function (DUF2914)